MNRLARRIPNSTYETRVGTLVGYRFICPNIAPRRIEAPQSRRGGAHTLSAIWCYYLRIYPRYILYGNTLILQKT